MTRTRKDADYAFSRDPRIWVATQGTKTRAFEDYFEAHRWIAAHPGWWMK